MIGSLLFLLSIVNHQAHVHQTREGLTYKYINKYTHTHTLDISFYYHLNINFRIYPNYVPFFSKAKVGRWSVWRWWAHTAGSSSYGQRTGSWLHWFWAQGNVLKFIFDIEVCIGVIQFLIMLCAIFHNSFFGLYAIKSSAYVFIRLKVLVILYYKAREIYIW